jgi:hypothetical protein
VYLGHSRLPEAEPPAIGAVLGTFKTGLGGLDAAHVNLAGFRSWRGLVHALYAQLGHSRHIEAVKDALYATPPLSTAVSAIRNV